MIKIVDIITVYPMAGVIGYYPFAKQSIMADSYDLVTLTRLGKSTRLPRNHFIA
jgi:hypothetical protein